MTRTIRMTRTIPTGREATAVAEEAAHAAAPAGAEALGREQPLMITGLMPSARKDGGKALARMEDNGPLS